MPEEYYIFIDIWRKYPSIDIHPIPFKILEGISRNQFKWLESKVINMVQSSDLKRLVSYCPILYKFEGLCTLKVLCYVNVVDPQLESDFPIDSNRFCVIQVTTNYAHATVDLENGFEAAVKDKSDAIIHIKDMDGECEFYPGDVIEVSNSNYNDGFYEVQAYTAHDMANRIELRGVGLNPLTKGNLWAANQLKSETAKTLYPKGKSKEHVSPTITCDRIRTGFRKFEYEIMSMTEKICEGVETRFLHKNIASDLDGFTPIFRRF
jgi:hypothetical protein